MPVLTIYSLLTRSPLGACVLQERQHFSSIAKHHIFQTAHCLSALAIHKRILLSTDFNVSEEMVQGLDNSSITDNACIILCIVPWFVEQLSQGSLGGNTITHHFAWLVVCLSSDWYTSLHRYLQSRGTLLYVSIPTVMYPPSSPWFPSSGNIAQPPGRY